MSDSMIQKIRYNTHLNNKMIQNLCKNAMPVPSTSRPYITLLNQKRQVPKTTSLWKKVTRWHVGKSIDKCHYSPLNLPMYKISLKNKMTTVFNWNTRSEISKYWQNSSNILSICPKQIFNWRKGTVKKIYSLHSASNPAIFYSFRTYRLK